MICTVVEENWYPTHLGLSLTLDQTISQVPLVGLGLDKAEESPVQLHQLQLAGEGAQAFVQRLRDIGGLSGLVLIRPNGFTLAVEDVAAWEQVIPAMLEALRQSYGFTEIRLPGEEAPDGSS